MSLTAKILKKQGLNGEIIKFKGKNLFEKTFSAILLANWTSYYLALNYKIDPQPAKLAESFKKKMRK